MQVPSLLKRALTVYREGGGKKLAKHSWSYIKNNSYKIIGDRPYRLIHKRKYGKHAPDSYQLIHIDPEKIDYLLSRRFMTSYSPYASHIVGGDWDINTTQERLMYVGEWEKWQKRVLIPFEKYEFYKSAKSHFDQGIQWKDTKIYKWFVITADRRPSTLNYSSESDIQEGLKQFDNLYHAIQKEGYQMQSELQATARETDSGIFAVPPEHDEVWINIGRDGSFILEEGRHRVVISKILGLESIPVRIFVRHKKWQQTRQNCFYTKSESANQAHPDLIK